MNRLINLETELSDEQIFDYVKERLTSQERLLVELHLLESPCRIRPELIGFVFCCEASNQLREKAPENISWAQRHLL